jgi:hypothetical protein
MRFVQAFQPSKRQQFIEIEKQFARLKLTAFFLAAGP